MFFDKLQEQCQKKRTNPTAVCLALGMSKSNVTKWKAGRSPNLKTVQQIAEHLGVSPLKLIPKKEDDMKEE